MMNSPLETFVPQATADVLCRRGESWLEPAFQLDSGEVLERPRLAWLLAGPDGAPVIIALGGISAHRRVGDEDAQPGWWREQCGPGQALDTRRFRVLGVDWLGGSHDSTGPRGDTTFPEISSRDQARAIALLLERLGIAEVELLAGASYGGCVAQHLAAQLGPRLRRCVLLCAAHRATRFAIGLRYVQREILALGLTTGRAHDSLAVARSLAMLTYRTAEEFEQRFDTAEDVAGYLCEQGERFRRHYDPVAALRLAASLDGHDFEPETLAVPTRIIGFSSDLLVPPGVVQEFARRVPRAELTVVGSQYGHDAFLKEVQAVAALLRESLPTEGH